MRGLKIFLVGSLLLLPTLTLTDSTADARFWPGAEGKQEKSASLLTRIYTKFFPKKGGTGWYCGTSDLILAGYEGLAKANPYQKPAYFRLAVNDLNLFAVPSVYATDPSRPFYEKNKKALLRYALNTASNARTKLGEFSDLPEDHPLPYALEDTVQAATEVASILRGNSDITFQEITVEEVRTNPIYHNAGGHAFVLPGESNTIYLVKERLESMTKDTKTKEELIAKYSGILAHEVTHSLLRQQISPTLIENSKGYWATITEFRGHLTEAASYFANDATETIIGPGPTDFASFLAYALLDSLAPDSEYRDMNGIIAGYVHKARNPIVLPGAPIPYSHIKRFLDRSAEAYARKGIALRDYIIREREGSDGAGRLRTLSDEKTKRLFEQLWKDMFVENMSRSHFMAPVAARPEPRRPESTEVAGGESTTSSSDQTPEAATTTTSSGSTEPASTNTGGWTPPPDSSGTNTWSGDSWTGNIPSSGDTNWGTGDSNTPPEDTNVPEDTNTGGGGAGDEGDPADGGTITFYPNSDDPEFGGNGDGIANDGFFTSTTNAEGEVISWGEYSGTPTQGADGNYYWEPVAGEGAGTVWSENSTTPIGEDLGLTQTGDSSTGFTSECPEDDPLCELGINVDELEEEDEDDSGASHRFGGPAPTCNEDGSECTYDDAEDSSAAPQPGEPGATWVQRNRFGDPERCHTYGDGHTTCNTMSRNDAEYGSGPEGDLQYCLDIGGAGCYATYAATLMAEQAASVNRMLDRMMSRRIEGGEGEGSKPSLDEMVQDGSRFSGSSSQGSASPPESEEACPPENIVHSIATVCTRYRDSDAVHCVEETPIYRTCSGYTNREEDNCRLFLQPDIHCVFNASGVEIYCGETWKCSKPQAAPRNWLSNLCTAQGDGRQLATLEEKENLPSGWTILEARNDNGTVIEQNDDGTAIDWLRLRRFEYFQDCSVDRATQTLTCGELECGFPADGGASGACINPPPPNPIEGSYFVESDGGDRQLATLENLPSGWTILETGIDGGTTISWLRLRAGQYFQDCTVDSVSGALSCSGVSCGFPAEGESGCTGGSLGNAIDGSHFTEFDIDPTLCPGDVE